jgi:hypothetical protein
MFLDGVDSRMWAATTGEPPSDSSRDFVSHSKALIIVGNILICYVLTNQFNVTDYEVLFYFCVSFLLPL